jgi:Ca-activated chloride channel family protein
MQDNDLKHRLKGLQPPPPSEDAKQGAEFAAMQAFYTLQEKKRKTRKGFGIAQRPIHATFVALENAIGRFTMKKAYVFAGSMAALATVLLVTTTHYSAVMQQVVPMPEVAVTAPVVTPLVKEDEEKTKTDQVVSTVAGSELAARDAVPIEVMEKRAEKKSAPPPSPSMTASATTLAAPPPPPMKAGSMKSEFARSSGVAAPGVSAQILQEAFSSMQPAYISQNKFDGQKTNPVKLTREEPVSTFSIDVDTASYSFVRRMINQGQLPPKDAVRVEEMINYFSYDYALPESKDEPFKPTVAVYTTPWNAETKLVHIGIKGHDIAKNTKPHSNLVFLIDVSGSMNQPDKLPLVKTSLKMLLDQMQADDTIGIVTYAGYSGVALEPTKISDKQKIISVIDSLGAGGGTAGAAGIEDAYRLAESNFDKNGVNRVILATDGDFNVGISDQNQLQSVIEKKRESGVFLSILGFGQGNYNDALMQTLAQHGNGNAAYIDNLNEARKVLVEEAGSTLFTIAKDVKIQVEFNPALVSEYRLIGYESRLLNREDFNNDKIDAGEVGSGHAVTAIYEITPAGGKSQQVDNLRYGKQVDEKKPEAAGNFNGEYAFLKMRYKLPKESESKLITTPITTAQEKPLAQQSDDIRFAASVAAFGQLLKGDVQLGKFTYDDATTLAEGAKGKDAFGYRSEFVNLTRLTKTLQGSQPVSQPAPDVPQPVRFPDNCPNC